MKKLCVGLLLCLALWNIPVTEAVVKNPHGYSLQFASNATGFDPADATTYYLGGLFSMVPQTAGTTPKVSFPKNGIVKKVILHPRVFGVASSATPVSTVSFRLNNSTDTTITSSLDSSLDMLDVYTANISVAVVAGDYFTIKWVTPTWVTNPTTVGFHGVVYIDVP